MSHNIQNKNSGLRALVLSSVAIILEWFDFLIFGFYAVYISKLFFPFQNETYSLITTFLIFGVSFLFRPLGALVISHIGDRYGRKNALILTVLLMTLPTFLIGVLPTYGQIGITATALIIFLRILQGFSLGGERSSTLSILVEIAPEGSRGLYTIFAGLSTTLGIILASLVCGIISNYFTDQQMLEFGWRIPFLMGILTGFAVYFLRKHLDESAKFQEVKSSKGISESPITEAVYKYRKQVVSTFLCTIMFAVGFYIIFVYLITFSVTFGKMQLPAILAMNTVNMFIGTLFLPFFGHLSDRFGRRPLLIAGAIGTAVSPFFLFTTFSGDSYVLKFAVQFLSGLMLFIYAGGLYPFLVELFPTRIRMTGISLGHVMAFSVFGGSAPFIATYLIEKSGDFRLVTYYVALTAVISLLTVFSSVETYKNDLK